MVRAIKIPRLFAHRLKRRTLETKHLLGLRLKRLIYHVPSIGLEYIAPTDIEIEPPILEDICLPPYFGPTDHDDYLPLMKIVKALQPSVVVELGTAHGNLTANICQQCPQATVYTVNAPAELQTGEMVTYQLSLEDIGRVYKNYGFANRVVQIFENTLDLNLSEFLAGQVVDLAIIDACHDTDYVINDFHKVEPFVKPRGIVLLHDTHPSMENHLAGSYIACAKLRRRGFDIKHIENTWWAFWEKKAHQPKTNPLHVYK